MYTFGCHNLFVSEAFRTKEKQKLPIFVVSQISQHIFVFNHIFCIFGTSICIICLAFTKTTACLHIYLRFLDQMYIPFKTLWYPKNCNFSLVFKKKLNESENLLSHWFKQSTNNSNFNIKGVKTLS